MLTSTPVAQAAQCWAPAAGVASQRPPVAAAAAAATGGQASAVPLTKPGHHISPATHGLDGLHCTSLTLLGAEFLSNNTHPTVHCICGQQRPGKRPARAQAAPAPTPSAHRCQVVQCAGTGTSRSRSSADGSCRHRMSHRSDA